MVPTSYTQATLTATPLPGSLPGPPYHPPYEAVIAPTSLLDIQSVDSTHQSVDPPSEGRTGELGREGGAGSGRPPTDPVTLFPRTISPARASLTQLGTAGLYFISPSSFYTTYTTSHHCITLLHYCTYSTHLTYTTSQQNTLSYPTSLHLLHPASLHPTQPYPFPHSTTLLIMSLIHPPITLPPHHPPPPLIAHLTTHPHPSSPTSPPPRISLFPHRKARATSRRERISSFIPCDPPCHHIVDRDVSERSGLSKGLRFIIRTTATTTTTTTITTNTTTGQWRKHHHHLPPYRLHAFTPGKFHIPHSTRKKQW